MSKAKDLAAAIAAQIATITEDNGYATNIGLKVYRGRATIPQESLPCVVLLEADDKVLDDNGSFNRPASVKMAQVSLAQRYIIEGHDECDPDNPNDKSHDIIADLKKAIFSGDRTFGGVVRRINYVGRMIGRRDDGLAVISAAVMFDAEFPEDLTNP